MCLHDHTFQTWPKFSKLGANVLTNFKAGFPDEQTLTISCLSKDSPDTYRGETEAEGELGLLSRSREGKLSLEHWDDSSTAQWWMHFKVSLNISSIWGPPSQYLSVKPVWGNLIERGVTFEEGDASQFCMSPVQSVSLAYQESVWSPQQGGIQSRHVEKAFNQCHSSAGL